MRSGAVKYGAVCFLFLCGCGLLGSEPDALVKGYRIEIRKDVWLEVKEVREIYRNARPVSFPRVSLIEDRYMLMALNVGVHGSDEERTIFLSTRDARHWSADPSGWRGEVVYNINDNDIFSLPFLAGMKDGDPLKWKASAQVSRNVGYNWMEEESVFSVPFKSIYFAFMRPIIEARDGALLISAYGRKQEESGNLDMSCVFRSEDSGDSWNYLATIGDPKELGQKNLDLIEGFNEPTIIRLPNGDILAWMRTCKQVVAGAEMYATRSEDDGVSWEKPYNLGVPGKQPQLLVVDNSLLVASFGPPGVSLWVDPTATGFVWPIKIIVTSYPTCGYTSLIETGEKSFVLFYTNHWPNRNLVYAMDFELIGPD